MIDAYEISGKMKELWSKMAMTNGADLKKHFNEVPVYVREGNNLYKIVDIIEEDNKIILVKESL